MQVKQTQNKKNSHKDSKLYIFCKYIISVCAIAVHHKMFFVLYKFLEFQIYCHFHLEIKRTQSQADSLRIAIFLQKKANERNFLLTCMSENNWLLESLFNFHNVWHSYRTANSRKPDLFQRDNIDYFLVTLQLNKKIFSMSRQREHLESFMNNFSQSQQNTLKAVKSLKELRSGRGEESPSKLANKIKVKKCQCFCQILEPKPENSTDMQQRVYGKKNNLARGENIYQNLYIIPEQSAGNSLISNFLMTQKQQKARVENKFNTASQKNIKIARMLQTYSPTKNPEDKFSLPKSKQLKAYILKKSQIYASETDNKNIDEIKSMKKSACLEYEGPENNDLFYKQLRSNMSTLSSNRSVEPELRITDFILGWDLGKGKFGNVKLAKHRKTGMLFSIKVINKSLVKQQKIINQVIKQTKLQAFLDHSHIVKLYSIFDDKENIYLLQQFCSDGNLYEYMQAKGRINEAQASSFMKQTCQAVRQLHFHRIIHRDIKPENIVMCFGMIKLCDFGWSTQMKEQMRDTFCGSPLYISPQLLKGQLYDQKVDIWALGILGFEMMTGKIPFQITTEKDLGKIIDSKIKYPSKMSPLAVSFLKQILQKNPSNRSNVKKLLSHPFLSTN